MTDTTEITVNITSGSPKIGANVETGGGAITSADKSFVFEQASASAVWSINHGQNKFCSVTIVDSAGNEVVGEVCYIDKNNIEIHFSSAFSGKAYLN